MWGIVGKFMCNQFVRQGWQSHLELMEQFPDRKLDPKTGKEVETRRRVINSWEISPEVQ